MAIGNWRIRGCDQSLFFLLVHFEEAKKGHGVCMLNGMLTNGFAKVRQNRLTEI
jgi:hypothetical protein